MNDLKTVSDIVQQILENDPESRNSDNYLFYKICNFYLRPQGINVRTIGFKELFLNLKKYGIPQFETVGRCRRKLQEQNPNLCGCKSVMEQRAENENEFKEYAKG